MQLIDSTSLDGQILSPDVIANPYPYYHRLRTHAPVYFDKILGMWLVSGYTEAVAVLSNTNFSSVRDINFIMRRAGATEGEDHPVLSQLSNSLTYTDPPVHTRLRHLIGKSFSPTVMRAIRPHIQQIVDALLDKVQNKGHMDVLTDLSYPLAQIVICEMLGVEPEMRDSFKGWADDFVALLGSTKESPDLLKQGDKSSMELYAYFRDIAAQHRKHPQDNLISILVLAQEQGDRLSEDELFATCATLLTGGYETTANLIGNAIVSLIGHPEQMERLRQNADAIASAVEELLRYDSPAQWGQRIAKKDITIGSATICRGQTVLIGRAAANRDPAQFVDPDRLDIDRTPNNHIAFGYGIHHCVGNELARIETSIAINSLLKRMKNFKLATDTLTWRPNMHIRALTSLPLVFETSV